MEAAALLLLAADTTHTRGKGGARLHFQTKNPPTKTSKKIWGLLCGEVRCGAAANTETINRNNTARTALTSH